MQKKPIIIGAAIVLVALIIIGFFLVHSNDDDSSKNKDDKKSGTEQSSTSTTSQSSSESTNATTTTKPSSFSVSVTTPVDGEQIDGDVVSVRTIVNGTSSGECTVTFSNSAYDDVQVTAPVGQVTSYSTCQGFDIDKSKFQGPGTWTFVVEVAHNGERASSKKQTVVIK